MHPLLFGSRMANNQGLSIKKVEPAGLGLGFDPKSLGVGALYSLPRFSLSVFWVCLLVRSGE